MSLKRDLARALREEDLVLEMWWDGEAREYRCLASKGPSPAAERTTVGGRTPEAAVAEARKVMAAEFAPAPREPKKRAGEIDVAAARARVEAGESLAAVAGSLGVSRATLYHRLRKEKQA